jgi:hypothetical protein
VSCNVEIRRRVRRADFLLARGCGRTQAILLLDHACVDLLAAGA